MVPYPQSTFAHAVGDRYDPPRDTIAADHALANYGTIFLNGVKVMRSGQAAPAGKLRSDADADMLGFDADADLLAIVRTVAAGIRLARCDAALCLRAQPKVVMGVRGL